MANTKISALATAAGLAGTETVPIVQSAATVKATVTVLAAAPVAKNSQVGTAYTLVLADAGKVIEMNNAAANTLTVPANATAAFAIGTRVTVFQQGAGLTTIAAAAGVTILSRLTLKSAGQYAALHLRKRDTDAWVLSGDISAT